MEWADVLATARFGAPMMLATLAGFVAARVRLFNVAMDSTMAAGAFAYSASWIAATYWWQINGAVAFTLSFACGLSAGAVCGLSFGAFVVRMRLDPIVAGVALTMIIVGAIDALDGSVMVWLVDRGTKERPVGGLSEPGLVFFGLAVLLIWMTSWFYSRNPLGLHAFGAGLDDEGASAAAEVGIDASSIQLWSSVVSSMLAATAGISLAIMSGVFTRGITAGRGYLALALALLWARNLWVVSLAALLYGLLQTPAVAWWISDLAAASEGLRIHAFLAALPFWLTLFLLALPESLRRGWRVLRPEAKSVRRQGSGA